MGCKSSLAGTPRANQRAGGVPVADATHTVRRRSPARSRECRRDAEAGGTVLGPCIDSLAVRPVPSASFP